MPASGRGEEAGPFALPTAEHPLVVKVVVLAMFEVGHDEGDTPGELQFWVERRHLRHEIPLPAGYHSVRAGDDGVVATVTGEGTGRAAASVMALGLDARFDLSRAYWLVAGIAGINPKKGSIGSAVWADYVVDGDLAYEFDARQVPPGWSTGILPLSDNVPSSGLQPFAKPHGDAEAEAYALDPALVHWAFNLTRDLPLADSTPLRENRSRYLTEAGRTPPKVLLGSTLSSSRFWHGRRMNAWAAAWVPYWTDGKGEYYTTAMEDSGTLQSLNRLARAGRVDLRRVLVLRTASNFDSEPPSRTAVQNLADEVQHTYSAYLPSLEAAFQVGNKAVDALLKSWPAGPEAAPSP
ncbi:MAG TPA: purine nucleoside permease [Chthoniobacterales bacterium]